MDAERVSLPSIGSMLHVPSTGPVADATIKKDEYVSSVQITPQSSPQALQTLQPPPTAHHPHPHQQQQQQQQYPHLYSLALSPPPSPFVETFHQPTPTTRPSTRNHEKNRHRRAYSTESFLDEHQQQLRMYKKPTLEPHDQQQQHRYRCPTCSKPFSRPSSLRVHTYSHTGEKPHRCPLPGCGRRFSVQSNMRRHLRVHYCSSLSDDQQQQQQQQPQEENERAFRPNGGAAVGPIPSLVPSDH